MAAEIELRISGLAGALCAVAAERWWRGRDVKAAVERLIGIPAREQRLVIGTVELASEGALADLLPDSETDMDVALLRQPAEQAEWIERVVLAGPFACSVLAGAPKSIKGDHAVLLVAVQQNGLALQLAAEHLRCDRDLVLAAVTQSGWALRFAAEHLNHDRDIVLTAVRQNGLALGNVPQMLREDRELVMEAVRQDGHSLQFAGAALRADREVVAAAVAQTQSAWQFASPEVQVAYLQARSAGMRPRSRNAGFCKFDTRREGVCA